MRKAAFSKMICLRGTHFMIGKEKLYVGTAMTFSLIPLIYTSNYVCHPWKR